MTDAVLTAGQTVRECVSLMRDGRLGSEQLVGDCLSIIDASESRIGAWAHLDREHALSQARAMDERRRRGQALGALHGIPIGIKDIVDTADLPTTRGTRIHADRQPEADAAIVEKLREAGAVILGKTVTTELAWMHPSETRNPHNPDYSPGGSSSGSAAAVAAGHVPLAIGSQTGGSVIRPASYCGIFGFKPSRGIVSRRGVLETSPSLDQLGVFGRDVGDMALLCDVIKGYDAADAGSYLAPRPDMLAGYLADAPIEPTFVWIDLPYRDRYSDDVNDGFEELMHSLGTTDGGRVERIEAPRSLAALVTCHQIIYDVEIARSLDHEWQHHRDALSRTARDRLEKARSRSEDEYQEACGIMQAANDWFAQFFHDYDAILTPSATGIPPRFGEGTGDPICCVAWTLCGLPCLSLPLLAGTGDLPIGVQLVGAHDRDDRLLRTTRWLVDRLRAQDDTADPPTTVQARA